MITISFLAFDAAFRAVIALTIVYNRRPAPVTLAWLLLLLFVPVISGLMYLLIGERRMGVRRLRRYEDVSRRVAIDLATDWNRAGLDASGIEGPFATIARYGAGVTGVPPLRGNRVTLLPDNDSMLASIVSDIQRAKHHVHLQTFIWNCDPGADRVLEAMIGAAQRGVECRVLLDGVGSWSFIGCPQWERMLAAGVKCVEALPVSIMRRPFARIDLRNHRKIAVIDGQIGYCGSQNLHDSSFRSTKRRKTGAWVDASVRLEGPVVQALGATFIKDWHLDSEEDLSGKLEALLPPPVVHDDPDSIAQVIPSGPGPSPQAIHQAFLTLLYTAREELVMTTPYFVPDEATLAALIAAAARGVRVTIIMPSIGDSWLVAAASRAHYRELLDAGVHIHHYARGLLHAKTITVDRSFGLIGSANFDARSFFLNFEVTLLVYDANFTASLRQMQSSYLKHAYEILAPEWRKRPWYRTLAENAVGLAGPLL